MLESIRGVLNVGGMRMDKGGGGQRQDEPMYGEIYLVGVRAGRNNGPTVAVLFVDFGRR